MDIYKFVFEDKRIIYRRPDQEIQIFDFVRPPKKGSDRDWEIVTSSELYRRLSLKNPKIYVKMCVDTSHDSKDFKIHPYVIGSLLGDGSIQKDGVTINKPYLDFIRRFESLLPSGYCLNKVTDIIWQISRSGASVPFYKLLQETGIGPVLSQDKSVPSAYLRGDVTQRKELLSGLLDTDGGVSKDKSVVFYSASPSLALGVRDLVWGLGGVAKTSMHDRGTKVFNGVVRPVLPEYRVNIKYPTPWELFNIQHKANNLKEPTRFSNNPKLKIIGVVVEEFSEYLDYNDSSNLGVIGE